MATALLSPSRLHIRSLSCLWPLIPLRGSLLLVAHAYHGPPTSAPRIRMPQNTDTPTRSEFVGYAYILSTASSLGTPLSCETFRPEPATRQFVWSFAPMPMSYNRVEHQNGSDPPPAFLRASVSTGIVHCLSGPTATTHRSPSTPAILCIRLAAAVVSLVRVSIRVRVLGLLPCIFTFHLLTEPFHFSLAVLILYRPPPYI